MNLIKHFFTGLKAGLHDFSSSISLAINTFLLAFVYFFAVGPTWAIARLKKKEFLKLKKDKKKSTYWLNLNLRKKPLKHYYRQF
ncbi:MAG: hypothetical protein ABIC19_03650 [Patescibacteria group bacterium]|nr:hypothetical protein [Patescibacteria group bacterium]